MKTFVKPGWQNFVLATLTALALTGCGNNDDARKSEGTHGEAAGSVVEKGSHNGRLLKDKSFTLELAIFETGVPPEYRAWAFDDGKAVAPKDIDLKIKLTRFGNKIDAITFVPENDFLRSTTSIYEPHSFIVNVTATYKGKAHQFQYESFEGRTKIDPKVAAGLEIQTEVAGPVTLHETISVYGKVIADPALERAVGARFDGIITAVQVNLGDQVSKGQALFTVESNESLRPVAVHAPISGVIALQQAKVGEQTQGKTLIRIVDNSKSYAELAVFSSQVSRVKKGAIVTIGEGNSKVTGTVEHVGVEASANQSVSVRVKLDGGQLPLGSQITAQINVADYDVPLAIKRVGLQAFRDFTVVFAQVGDEYEVRMLELGREAGEWIEVLGGLEPGTRYVTENSFVVKADIEKSGASHDH
ncbi:MAG: HlyD family efflux transporter periplasmic adaptor subunit [Gammaproteobacteria bacterium]|nr:MAG: HlyD family efflux transporter periplasmic adaptor subunit [Gammaproteobacteria bacterium]